MANNSIRLFNLLVLIAFYQVSAFQPTSCFGDKGWQLSAITTPDVMRTERTLSESPCYWKPEVKGSRWHRRIHLEDICIGQKLSGSLVQELLAGKTGPKMFFECGIGRTDTKGKWNIVNAMLRLDRAKESVTKKRASRIRKKDIVDLWVSRIQSGCGRLEVCLTEEALERYIGERKKPVSSLKPGEEVKGRVVRLHPYGAIVDVGANRVGLLHIKKVRDLCGTYVDKEKGLAEVGLERGAKVRLQVESVEKMRLSLDFTDDVKEESKADQGSKSIELTASAASRDGGLSESDAGMSEDKLAEWAAFASPDILEFTASEKSIEDTVEENDDDDDDDDDDVMYDAYDEERDIEDSLGLGFY